MADDKVRYTKPTSQVDLEERQKNHNESSRRVDRGADAPLSDNGYVGVDTVYQNAANDTERPRQTEKGPEAKVFNEFIDDDAEFPELDADKDDEDADATTESSTPPPTGTGSTTTTSGSGSGSGNQ